MNEAAMDWARSVFTGPWSTVWPMVLLPVLALLFLPHRKIEDLWSNPRVQLLAAAIAACIPGVVTVFLALFSIQALRTMSPQTLGCYIKLYGPLAIAGFLFLRASGLLLWRKTQLNELRHMLQPPRPRLSALGRSLGLSVWEIPSLAPICMVCGVFRPYVVVSTYALESLDEEGLHAALLHELAHIHARDTLWSAVVTFASECAPFRAEKVIELHRMAQELLADRAVARHALGKDLAAALVQFARRTLDTPLTQPLVRAGGLERRVRLLLGIAEPQPRHSSVGFPIFASLACVASLGLYPLAARLIDVLIFHCSS